MTADPNSCSISWPSSWLVRRTCSAAPRTSWGSGMPDRLSSRADRCGAITCSSSGGGRGIKAAGAGRALASRRGSTQGQWWQQGQRRCRRLYHLHLSNLAHHSKHTRFVLDWTSCLWSVYAALPDVPAGECCSTHSCSPAAAAHTQAVLPWPPPLPKGLQANNHKTSLRQFFNRLAMDSKHRPCHSVSKHRLT